GRGGGGWKQGAVNGKNKGRGWKQNAARGSSNGWKQTAANGGGRSWKQDGRSKNEDSWKQGRGSDSRDSWKQAGASDAQADWKQQGGDKSEGSWKQGSGSRNENSWKQGGRSRNEGRWKTGSSNGRKQKKGNGRVTVWHSSGDESGRRVKSGTSNDSSWKRGGGGAAATTSWQSNGAQASGRSDSSRGATNSHKGKDVGKSWNDIGNEAAGSDQEDDSSEGWGSAIPGEAGQDYPNFDTIPKTDFDCQQHQYPGYYGDVEARCQVFHICQADGRLDSFLCPVGTIFNQKYFVCDWWNKFKCEDTPNYYQLNANLYEDDQGSASEGSRSDDSWTKDGGRGGSWKSNKDNRKDGGGGGGGGNGSWKNEGGTSTSSWLEVTNESRINHGRSKGSKSWKSKDQKGSASGAVSTTFFQQHFTTGSDSGKDDKFWGKSSKKR
ncbi:uncharacterized transmembrane protein DDB_G0289901-like, partial [Centruroides sculpturatus]|uniref:uncharacterized transmembrane protein DDB_G0289901-like n=1 Tax=Centruroides sculpturatus TaxID=218467 RepID=UPI000C6C9124